MVCHNLTGGHFGAVACQSYLICSSKQTAEQPLGTVQCVHVCATFIYTLMCERNIKHKIKLKFYIWFFFNLGKGLRNLWTRFTMQWQRNFVDEIFAFLSFGFCGAAPIPYLQGAILNLHHPYL